MAPQTLRLFVVQPEHQIFRESGWVALYCPVQLPCLDPIQLREISIEHDLLAADGMDECLDGTADGEALGGLVGYFDDAGACSGFRRGGQYMR